VLTTMHSYPAEHCGFEAEHVFVVFAPVAQMKVPGDLPGSVKFVHRSPPVQDVVIQG